MVSTESDTKARILDAAEFCFAEAGFDATSMRAITARAQVNLAAANYHFGTKEALFVAVFARRIGPINARRQQLLYAVERKHKSGPLPLEPVLEALFQPALALAQTEEGRRVLRLVGRIGAEKDDLFPLLDAQFAETKRRFLGALQRALPDLPLVELFWRTHFLIGAMLHTLCDMHRLKVISGGLCDPTDVAGALRRLVPFIAGGLRAPLPEAAR